MEQKVRQVLSVSLMQDGTTCMDVAMEVDGKPEIWHIPGGPVTVEEQEKPIDLAQLEDYLAPLWGGLYVERCQASVTEAAQKEDPWFGLGHTLVPKREVTEPGMLPLADIRALHEQMFTTAQAEPAFQVHPKRMHWLRRMYAQGKRYARWRKIRKRQRRAAQRRHARGEQ